MLFFKHTPPPPEKKKDGYESYMYRRSLLNKLSSILYDYVMEQSYKNFPKYIGGINLSKTMVSHIKPGDKVVVNIFDFIKSSSNGWDSGKSLFVGHFGVDTAPIVGVVEKIYVTGSLLSEKLDKYFDNHYDDYADPDYLEYLINNPQVIIAKYTEYVNKREHDPTSIFDKYGLYMEAKVRLTFDGKEQVWSVNTHTFVSLDTEYGKYTLNTWYKLYKLYKKQQEIAAELKCQQDQLGEEIANINMEIKLM